MRLFKKAFSIFIVITFLCSNIAYADINSRQFSNDKKYPYQKLRVPVGQALTQQRMEYFMAAETSNKVTRLADELEEDAKNLVSDFNNGAWNGPHGSKKSAEQELEEQFIKRIIELDGIKEKIPTLIEVAKSDRGPIVKAAFIRALGKIHAKEASSDLLDIWRDKPESIIVRRALKEAFPGVGLTIEDMKGAALAKNVSPIAKSKLISYDLDDLRELNKLKEPLDKSEQVEVNVYRLALSLTADSNLALKNKAKEFFKKLSPEIQDKVNAMVIGIGEGDNSSGQDYGLSDALSIEEDRDKEVVKLLSSLKDRPVSLVEAMNVLTGLLFILAARAPLETERVMSKYIDVSEDMEIKFNQINKVLYLRDYIADHIILEETGHEARLAVSYKNGKLVFKKKANINPFLLFEEGRDRGNITIDKKTIFIGMGGGDAAGLNDFIADTVERLTKLSYKVIGVRNGFKGLLKGAKLEDNLVELTSEIAASMRGLPSIALGSCREKLKEEDISRIVAILKPSAGAIFMGGNDHLKNVEQVAREAKKQNIDITVIGVPKSVDNDFMTSMLGFWGAVIAGRHIVSRASIDPIEKGNENKAAVFECMGRKSGSLTLEPSKACPYSHAVIVPEKPVTIDDIINAARKDNIKNFFVSEGFSLSENDPRLGELLNAYPVLKAMWEKIKTSPDKDQHGNPKLTGASLFVKGILEHFCGFKVEKTDLTYQLRGAFLHPDDKGVVFDTFLAEKFAEKAASMILEKRSGFALTYEGEYGDTNGVVEAKNPKDVYESRDLKNTMSDKDLAGFGVLGVQGFTVQYNARPEAITGRELSLEDAAREAFYEVAVSTLAHKYASVAEFMEPSDVIISSCGKDQADINKFPNDLRNVIEATKDSVLVLVPENYSSLSQIAGDIKNICARSGYINIAISKDFMLDPKDELLKSVLGQDPVLRARFKEGIVDEKTGLVRFESGVSNFIVGLFKYLIKHSEIKVDGTKITDFGYAFKGLDKSEGFNPGNVKALNSGV